VDGPENPKIPSKQPQFGTRKKPRINFWGILKSKKISNSKWSRKNEVFGGALEINSGMPVETWENFTLINIFSSIAWNYFSAWMQEGPLQTILSR